jgi:hypothetical protein
MREQDRRAAAVVAVEDIETVHGELGHESSPPQADGAVGPRILHFKRRNAQPRRLTAVRRHGHVLAGRTTDIAEA